MSQMSNSINWLFKEMGFIKRIGDYVRGSGMTHENLQKSRSEKCETDQELLEWWKNETTEKEYESDDVDEKKERNEAFLNMIYNNRHLIALDSRAFLHAYIEQILGIFWDSPPKDWSDKQTEEFYQKYPEFISARELSIKFPEVYKAGYVDKLKNEDNLITKIRLETCENKLKLENDEGYTLNEIAYLSHELFKINFWFNDYYRREASIHMNYKFEKDGTLRVYIGCDT